MSNAFASSGLRFSVDMSYDDIGDIAEYPWLRPSSFLESLVRNNQFDRLLGGKTLEESAPTLKVFWHRYRQQFPSHQLFECSVKSTQLERCLPIYLHGDEGTHFKRKGVLILAWQSAIGLGSRHSPNQFPSASGKLTDAGIPLNLLQTALQNRFLTAVCPKDS